MLCHEFVWVLLIRRFQSQSSRMSHFHTRLPVYFKWNKYNKESNVNLCSSSVAGTKKLVEKTDRNISALQCQATLRQVQHICLLALVQTEFKRSAFFWPQIQASGEDQHPSQFWQFAKTQTGLDYKSEALVAAEKCIFCHWGSRKPRETDTHLGGGKVTLLFICSWNLWCKYLCMRLRGILGSSFCPV